MPNLEISKGCRKSLRPFYRYKLNHFYIQYILIKNLVKIPILDFAIPFMGTI